MFSISMILVVCGCICVNVMCSDVVYLCLIFLMIIMLVLFSVIVVCIVDVVLFRVRISWLNLVCWVMLRVVLSIVVF